MGRYVSLNNTNNDGRKLSIKERIKNKSYPSVFTKLVAGAVVLGVFGFGILVGQGKVSLGIGGPANSSLQNQPAGKFNYSSVEDVYAKLRENYDGQLDNTKLEDGLKEGLVKAAGDPYTEYFNAEGSKELKEQLSGSFEGIGAELGKEEESIVIISPISGFPAEKAGIKARDIIYEIDGKPAIDLSINEAVKQIRGPKGTKVKLSIVRAGQRLDFEITREQINIPSVTSEIAEGNIGIIKISRFGEDTVELTTKAAKDLKSKAVRGVILDLRSDPGGYLDASVAVSSLWIERGKMVVQEKRGDKVIKEHKAAGTPLLSGVPTVVLVNEGSASASEIVAGALKDHKAASIIGVKTYGKGSVQQVLELSSGGALKVTVARWFTPNGRNIDKEGIEPDQKVELTAADTEAKRDPQKDAALAKLRQ